ncbi:MAG: SRPBCC domain-containing protein [Bauldia sp.]|nr:SRPBCC domain-containing protein [Bauldia sp.]
MPDTAPHLGTPVGSEAERTLVLERLLPAPPPDVFAAFTDPETLLEWWGPEGATVPESEFDIRPGGRWRTVLQTPDGAANTVSGVYRTIAPPGHLAFTWAWHGPDGGRGHETEVDITFEAAGRGTLMRLVQKLFDSPEATALHNAGWASSLNDLERLLAVR